MSLKNFLWGVVLGVVTIFVAIFVHLRLKEQTQKKALEKLMLEVGYLPTPEDIDSKYSERKKEIEEEIMKASEEEIIKKFEKAFPRSKK